MQVMKYVNVPSLNLTIAVPPKCGSNSVYRSLEKHFSVERLQYCPEVRLLKAAVVPKTGRIVFVVRDPVDRFRSLWGNKCRDGGKVRGTGDVQWGMSPAQMFAFIKTHKNHHWQHQSAMVRELPSTVDIEFVPLDRMEGWWAENTDFPGFGHENRAANSREVLSTALIAKLKEYYADDVALWERVSNE